MRRLWTRSVMLLVGIAILVVYTAGAFGGLLLLRWLLANPPDTVTLAVALPLAILVAGYVGYRLGTVRLVASLDAARLSRRRAPAVYRRLERLCGGMNVREPPVLVADLGAPNALSIGGPRSGVVVVDRRLFRLLTIDELEGILAHELAHLESYDAFLNTLALTAVRSIVGLVLLAVFPVVLLLAGIDRSAAWIAGRPRQRQVGLAALFQHGVTLLLSVVLGVVTLGFLAYSRRQEFDADRRAVAVTGNPAALARALSKLHRATESRDGLLSMLYTHDDRDERDREWLSTHPPVEKRVERLLELTGDTRHHHVGRLRP